MMSSNFVTYVGPKEVVANQPTVLVGTFDKSQIATVSAIAEDRFPLNVVLKPTSGVWYISLEKGFNTAGSRWFRVKGTDKGGRVLNEQVININVIASSTSDPLSIRLIALRDTFFKARISDASSLSTQQKVAVPVGQIYQVKHHALVENDHLKIELKTPLGSLGTIGYFYEEHLVLVKGASLLTFDPADLPKAPSGTLLLWVKQNTKFKLHPTDSSSLPLSQQADVSQGETLIILGYACVEDHFRVTLDRAILEIGYSGYLYSQHVQIFQGDREISYDPNALSLTILYTTPFKKRPISAVNLQPQEKTTLPAGMIYGVSSYVFEQGHVKVALTENLPQFGNTGYLYPDFVQFTRNGKSFNSSPKLTYTGPREVLVNQPTTLSGTFDPAQAITISLVAEDKYRLNVAVNRTTGRWQVSLPKGFSEQGTRWLRLKAIDSRGNITGSQIIYVTVSADPLTVGQSLSLRVLTDTFFKAAPIDSVRLNDQQKILVPAGQTLSVDKYGLVDGHLKVLLENSIAPIGTFGYLYEPHVQLSKGPKVLRFELEDVPDSHLVAEMLVTQTTFIKAQPVDSSQLARNQSAELILGSTYSLLGYASISGHFRVTLSEPIPGFGNVGYIYWRHVQIKRDGKQVAYDPDALTMTILQTTAFKKQPVSASSLSESQKVTLPLGRVYGVDSYGVEGDHLRVSLTEELPNFGNTGYIYPSYTLFKRGGKTFDPIPNYVELNVPYFSQRDNPRYYWSTCNVTSIAMVFYYYGVRARGADLVDELLQWCWNYAGEGAWTEHSVLSAMIRAYGFKTSFSTTRNWSDIKSELINRRPVVLAGNFTATGHILTVIGYSPSGYIVQDPWGDALTGYNNMEGRKLVYPYGYVDRVCGPEGNIWAHFISK